MRSFSSRYASSTCGVASAVTTLAPLISQAMVVGDDQKFVGALISLDEEAAKKHKRVLRYWRTRLAQDLEDARFDRSLRLVVLPRDAPPSSAPFAPNREGAAPAEPQAAPAPTGPAPKGPWS